MRRPESMTLRGLSCCLALGLSGLAWGQCSFSNLFNSSIQLVGGEAEVISCVQGGEYVAMEVVAGEIYQVNTCTSTSGGDSQLTLFDSSNTASSVQFDDDGCGLFSSLQYTSTFTGTLYAQVNEFNCLASTTCYTLEAQCLSCGFSGVGCGYRLDLFDSFGDGWNGASVSVLVNGSVFDSYTLSSGSSGSFDFIVNAGDIVLLDFSSGSFDDEITYEFFEVGLGSDQLLFQDGPSPLTGSVFVTECDPQQPQIFLDRFETLE